MSAHFKIIISFYNVDKWIRATIRSVKAQHYENFQCIITDDMSTDRSAAIVAEEISDDERFVFISNKEKKTALKNNAYAIAISNAEPQNVVVILDGDDWLASPDVLRRLHQEYQDPECWMTYGSYIEYPSGSRGKFCQPTPKQVIEENTFRQVPWVFSHLKTFRYGLWSKIKEVDLLDPSTGEYFTRTQDLAFMYPMLEMSGTHTRYIQEPLYIYNVSNPLNDHKIDHGEQLRIEALLKGAKAYPPLKDMAE